MGGPMRVLIILALLLSACPAGKDARLSGPLLEPRRNVMLIAMIEGVTRVCGESQGYQLPAMTTAWTPTPAELEALNRGASVYVRILGRVGPDPE
jgi:hypothetical protein